MKHSAIAIAIVALGLLAAGCNTHDSAADRQADQLDNAAAQSTGPAADVLENAADEIRESDGNGAAITENALDAAANAQASSVAPPSRQAKRHGEGDPVPAPKTDAPK